MIEQVMSLKSRYDKMVKGFKEEDFKGWFTEFFALYPMVTMIRWTQYTPYFNDGDECVFSVNDPEVELSLAYIQAHPGLDVTSAEYGDCVDDEGVDLPDRHISTFRIDRKYKKEYPDLHDALTSIKELFTAEDILRHVFGEHAEVVVTPEKIVVEEYEHD